MESSLILILRRFMNNGQPQRISYSFGMKLSLLAKYESADFHVSMTSDVDDSETVEQAMNRLKHFVHLEVGRSYEAVRASETGLIGEAVKQEPVPCKDVAPVVEKPKNKPVNPRVFKDQIKLAYGVLESKKQTTKDSFKATYLNNKKVDELTESETNFALTELKKNHPELGL